MALVDHATGAPFALPNFGDDGGERAVAVDLLERSGIAGRVITVDALHATRRTAQVIHRRCGADCVFTVKGNAPETFETLGSIDRERVATGVFEEPCSKAHGRTEQRSIHAMTPLKGAINCPGVSQIARITRCREALKTDVVGTDEDRATTACLITSLDADRASPEDLLQLNRRHRQVENLARQSS